MKHFRFLAALGACILPAALTAAPDTAMARPDARAHPRTVRVTIVTALSIVGRYKPKAITVHVGDRTVFRNASNAPHTVSADKGSFDSGTIAVGKSWTYTAGKVGTFTYFCQFHAGMHGKLIVKRR